ncbi:hypothetical protein RRG08_045264 [Elysia crispata]|uniref:Uncharacterized protein n=1 Tax=Elysia crispata TaxID=231223 RepID=A0AAE1DS03_9GAST|nr:hypothetical protein RRG08_045264 [Elysia crispata]
MKLLGLRLRSVTSRLASGQLRGMGKATGFVHSTLSSRSQGSQGLLAHHLLFALLCPARVCVQDVTECDRI